MEKDGKDLIQLHDSYLQLWKRFLDVNENLREQLLLVLKKDAEIEMLNNRIQILTYKNDILERLNENLKENQK